MGLVSKFTKQAKLLVLENIYSRKVKINLDRAIFSFTFDDVPLSAAKHGAEILERFGATGTYYVAMGMGDGQSQNKQYINEREIRFLYERGHNIGCHTFSHMNLRKNGMEEIEKDCLKNTKLLSSIIGGGVIEHFAYPFGMVSPWGKKVLSQKYKTLRTTDYGINTSITDMTHLRSVSLYTATFDCEFLLKTIQETIRKNGWLIFYTHDVQGNPSKWGVTIEQFTWIVDKCHASSGRIMNMDEAYIEISNS